MGQTHTEKKSSGSLKFVNICSLKATVKKANDNKEKIFARHTDKVIISKRDQELFQQRKSMTTKGLPVTLKPS